MILLVYTTFWRGRPPKKASLFLTFSGTLNMLVLGHRFYRFLSQMRYPWGSLFRQKHYLKTHLENCSKNVAFLKPVLARNGKRVKLMKWSQHLYNTSPRLSSNTIAIPQQYHNRTAMPQYSKSHGKSTSIPQRHHAASPQQAYGNHTEIPQQYRINTARIPQQLHSNTTGIQQQ